MIMPGLFNYPLFRYFSTTKELDKYFSLAKRKEFIQQYLDSIHLANGVSGTDTFTTYQKDHPKGLNDLLKFQVETGKKDDKGNPITMPALKGAHWDNLQKPDNAHAAPVKTAIKDALTETEALKTALAQYNADMKMLNERLQNPPLTGTPEEMQAYNSLIKNLPGMLHAAKVEAMDAIKKYQEGAKQNIEDLKTNSAFMNDFKNGTGLDDEEAKEAIDELAGSLEKANDSLLKQFETTSNESIITTHKGIQKEHDRIAFIAAMRTLEGKKFKDLQKAIDEAIEANEKKLNQTPGEHGEITLTPDSSQLRNIRVQDFPLQTITGRKINVLEDGSFNIQLPKFGVLFYNSYHQNVDYDMQSLAEAFKAAGNETVTINVNYDKDPEEAEEYARKMYESCINAGFEPDKISIIVNKAERKLTNPGKKDEAAGIFDGKEMSRFTATQKIAKKLKAVREDEAKPPKDTAEYKAKLAELRSAPMPTPQPDPTATPTTSPT